MNSDDYKSGMSIGTPVENISDNYQSKPSCKPQDTYHTQRTTRRRRVGTLGTLLVGASLLAPAPGCVGARPGLEGFFNPYAERVDHDNAGHANGYQAFMENDHPKGATGGYFQEFAPFGYVADTLKFPFLMMRKGFFALGHERPENPFLSVLSYIGQALLYIGHPLTEVIELLNDTPVGRTGFRLLDHAVTEDGAYQKQVNYGHEHGEPALLDVPEGDRNKLAAYDALKVITVTGAAAGGVTGASGSSSGSSSGSGNTNNPIPPVPPSEPGPGDGF